MTVKPKVFKDIDVPSFYLNNKSLKCVTSYTYLGVEITDDLSDSQDIGRQKSAIYARGNSLIRKFSVTTVDVKVQLFKSYISTFYCASLWNHYSIRSDYNRAVIAYKRIFRNLFSIKEGSITGYMVRLGCNPFDVVVRKSACSLNRRISESENSLLNVMFNSLYFCYSSLACKWRDSFLVNPR